MSNSRFLIYALVDPRTNSVRYIGKSTTRLARPKSHGLSYHLSHDRSRKANWIRSLRSTGVDYGIRVLQFYSSADDLNEEERLWIALGRQEGWDLTNLTDGGDGASSPMPEETRQKIREACNKPEAIEKMRRANKGKIVSEETRARASLAHKGIRPSAETRAKQSAARKGRVVSAATRAKLSAAKSGVPRPDLSERNRSPEGKQHLERLHEMARGRPRPDVAKRNRSQAQRDAVSKALDGRKFSEETIERMRQGQQRRHAQKIDADS